MIFAFASSLTMLLGVTIAVESRRHEAVMAARSEFVGGSLLATGLLLIGIGIEASF